MVFAPRLPQLVFGSGLAWSRWVERALAIPRRFAGAAAILALAALTFLPLLSRPDRFPAAGDPQAAVRAVADAVASARWEKAAGEVSYLDADLSGRSRAADPTSFHVHPLYYLLSRIVPAGLALTLTAVALVTILGLGSERLARGIGLDRGAAFLAGTIALFSGGIAVALASPASLGPASAAALTPLLCLTGHSLRRRPSPARAAFLALTIALALTGGSLTATALALALAAAGTAFLPRGWDPPEGESSSPAARSTAVTAALWIAGSVALGAALGAYRGFPLAAGNWEAFIGWSDIVSGPWWGSIKGPLQLPFYLGAITLVCLAGAVARVQTDRRAIPFLAATCAVAFLAPRAYVPFVAIPLALAGGLGAAQLAGLVPIRVPLGAVLAAVLTAEALPYHRTHLSGIGTDEIASSAQWIRFLERSGADDRTAVLGPDRQRFSLALAAGGILRSSAGDAPDLAAMEDLRSFEYLSPCTIVSDLPDPKRRLPLAYVDRTAGKYIYLNPTRLGPVYWTQRVEPLRDDAAEPRGAPRTVPMLRIPLQRGAVALDALRAAADPPGERYGRVKTFRRTANGFECRVDLPGEAVLVVTEPFLPSLSARVDGRPAEIFPANGNQIGLRLTAGRHHVACALRPPGIATGIAISALGAAIASLLLAAPAVALLARRNRRPILRPAGLESERERESKAASGAEAFRASSPLR